MATALNNNIAGIKSGLEKHCAAVSENILAKMAAFQIAFLEHTVKDD